MKYILKNLSCAHCAMQIEEKLNECKEIEKARVNFSEKTLDIQTENIEKAEKIIKSIEPSISLVDYITSDDSIRPLIVELSIPIMLYILAIILKNYHYHQVFYFLSWLFAGKNVLKNAFTSILKLRFFNENVLMSVSTISAFFIGYFAEACGVMIFFRIGELFQTIAIKNSKKNIKNLLDDKELVATLSNGEEISLKDIKVGDILVVKVGEKIPVDSVIIKGSSSIDVSSLTGESVPKFLEKGDSILAGSINLTDVITIKTEKTYNQSSFYKMMEIVEEATNQKTQTKTFIQNFAKYYTPFVLLLALLVLSLSPILFNITFKESLYNAIVLLVISCPCALVLSVPLTYYIALNSLSKQGILVKDITVFEKLRESEDLYVDKTGTLTKGLFSVVKIVEYFDNTNITEQDIFSLLYYAEEHSNHPISKGVIEFLKNSKNETYIKYRSFCIHCGCCHRPEEHKSGNMYVKEKQHILGHFSGDECQNHNTNSEINIDSLKINELKEIAGYGIYMKTDKFEVLIGNDKLFDKYNVVYPDSYIDYIHHESVIGIAINNQCIMALYLVDSLKENVKEDIENIYKSGIKNITLLTGDKDSIAKQVQKDINLTGAYSNLLPLDKLNIVKGKNNVIFVGDGINDVAVMSMADVGISMGIKGVDITVEASSIVLANDELSSIAILKKMSKKLFNVMNQNIFLIILVKIIIIGLGIFSEATLWEAVFGDVGITIVAILNSQRMNIRETRK